MVAKKKITTSKKVDNTEFFEESSEVDEFIDELDLEPLTTESVKKYDSSIDFHSENETKAEKFIRLLTYRVNKALMVIKGIEKLSNRSNYEYSQEQYEKATNALLQAVDCMSLAFEKSDRNIEKPKFSL